MEDDKLSNDEREIKERREKVNYLLIKGATEKTIAKQLGVSERTITRDVKFIREQASTWVDDLGKEGAIYECKLALDKLKDSELELNRIIQKLKDSTTIPEVEKELTIAKLVKQKDDNVTLQAQFVLEGPTLYAMKRGMSQLRFNDNGV